MTLLAHLYAFLHWAILTAIVNAWCFQLQPWQPNHTALAAKIAYVAIASPAFDDDVDGILTAANLTATVKDESSMKPHAIGDGGRSFGLVQAWGRKDLLDDDLGNLREGARQMRISFEGCPRVPYAMWFTGVCSHDKHVAFLSDRRIKLAARLLAGGSDLSTAVVTR